MFLRQALQICRYNEDLVDSGMRKLYYYFYVMRLNRNQYGKKI